MRRASEEPVRALRARIAEELARLRDLENQFEDSYFKKRAQRTASDLQEADSVFLCPLREESWRDSLQEARAISYAKALFQMALSQRKQLEDILKKYGPTVAATRPA